MTAILMMVLFVSLISVHESFARITCCYCDTKADCPDVECYSKACDNHLCVYNERSGGSCAGGDGSCENGDCIIKWGACNEDTHCDPNEDCSCPDCRTKCAGDLNQPPPPSGGSGSSCPGNPPPRYEDPQHKCPDGTGCLDIV